MVEFRAVAATGFGEEQVLTGEVDGLDGAALGERMAGIADEKDSLLTQRNNAVGRIGECVAHAKGEIDLAGLELRGVAGTDVGKEGELDAGKAAAEDAEDLGQAIGEDALRGADAERTAGLGAVANGALALFHGDEGLFGKGLKAAACVGECDAPAEAIEEWDAHLFFKRLDLRGHIRLDSVDALSGAGEVELFGQSAEDLELSDFHSGTPFRIENKKRSADRVMHGRRSAACKSGRSSQRNARN